MCIYISPICNVETRLIFCGNNKIRDSLFFSLHRGNISQNEVDLPKKYPVKSAYLYYVFVSHA